jgi:hypothetical protein
MSQSALLVFDDTHASYCPSAIIPFTPYDAETTMVLQEKETAP